MTSFFKAFCLFARQTLQCIVCLPGLRNWQVLWIFFFFEVSYHLSWRLSRQLIILLCHYTYCCIHKDSLDLDIFFYFLMWFMVLLMELDDARCKLFWRIRRVTKWENVGYLMKCKTLPSMGTICLWQTVYSINLQSVQFSVLESPKI